jgi:hypothetical protein
MTSGGNIDGQSYCTVYELFIQKENNLKNVHITLIINLKKRWIHQYLLD